MRLFNRQKTRGARAKLFMNLNSAHPNSVNIRILAPDCLVNHCYLYMRVIDNFCCFATYQTATCGTVVVDHWLDPREAITSMLKWTSDSPHRISIEMRQHLARRSINSGANLHSNCVNTLHWIFDWKFVQKSDCSASIFCVAQVYNMQWLVASTVTKENHKSTDNRCSNFHLADLHKPSIRRIHSPRRTLLVKFCETWRILSCTPLHISSSVTCESPHAWLRIVRLDLIRAAYEPQPLKLK